MTSGAEKRRFARLDMAVTVAYRVVSEGGEISEAAEALSSDISAGGIRLMTPGPLAPGAKVQLDIEIDDNGPPIPADGEVVWQQKNSETSYETGVVIVHMADQEKCRFLGFILDQMSALVGYAKSDERH